ncbi:MAG TPA: hypothetical protein VGB46_06110 [Flavisolibacter sp.]|jgi:hypothetical protein
MKTLACAFLALLFISCSNSGLKQEERNKSSYEAITDSNSVVRDSLEIPDSTTKTVNH